MKTPFLPVIAALLLVVAGCEPAPEERFERAQARFAEADYRAALIELRMVLQEQPEFAEARFLLGQASYKLSDFSAAQSEFERTLALGLEDPEVWLALGETLIAQGKATEVIERVMPNLPADASTAPQQVLLGNTMLALDNLTEASRHFQAALELDAASAGALIGLAVIAEQGGDERRADELLATAREKNPESAFVWRATGNLRRTRGDFPSAAEAYDRSIALESGATPLADRLMTRADRVAVLLDGGQVAAAAERLGEMRASFGAHPVVQFLEGRVAYAQGDFAAAETALRNYLTSAPNDMRGYALLGAVSFSRNQFHQAETYLQQAARNRVGGSQITRLLAETQLRLNKPDEALRSLSATDSGDTSDPVALAMFGRAALGMGDTAAALDYFEKGASIDNRSPAVSLALATGFFQSGDAARATEILESIPEQQDDSFRREALLMAAHVQSGKTGAALAVADELLRNNPDNAAALTIVGVVRQSMGDYDESRRLLEQALRLSPEHVPAMYAMSRVHFLTGDTGAAKDILRRSLAVEPAFMPALVALTSTLASEQRLDDVVPLLADAVAASPNAMSLRLVQIRVALMTGAADEALRMIASAREDIADDPRLQHAEGLAQAAQGQEEAAMANLRRAADEEQDNPVFQIDLASLALGSGDYRTALESAKRYRAVRPGDFRGLAVQAWAQMRSGDLAAARDSVAAFRNEFPGVGTPDLLVGDIELGAGETARAVSHYEAAARNAWNRDIALRLARAYLAESPRQAQAPLERWLDEHPDDAVMRRLYGQYLEQAGQTEVALQQYEKVLETEDDPVALNNLAWHYAESGRPEAVELARRAHELAPDNGSISDTYGWILFKQGDVAAALPILEQASRQSPDNPEIRYHLAVAHAEAGNAVAASGIIEELLATDDDFPSRRAAEELADSL